jgi:hypothetical protein
MPLALGNIELAQKFQAIQICAAGKAVKSLQFLLDFSGASDNFVRSVRKG